MVARPDRGGDFAEMFAAYERGTQPGEIAFAQVGEAAVERFGDDEAEDGVADELKLFIIGRIFSPGGVPVPVAFS